MLNLNLLPEFVDIYTRKQDTNTKEENNFLQCSWKIYVHMK